MWTYKYIYKDEVIKEYKMEDFMVHTSNNIIFKGIDYVIENTLIDKKEKRVDYTLIDFNSDKNLSSKKKNNSKKHSNKSDKIVEDVISQYRERSKLGIEKYGTSLENSKEDILAFLNHAQQEAMDLTLYLEKIKQMFYEQK